MPLITGLWYDLPEAALNEAHHFQGTALYIDPITRVQGTLTARQTLAAQAVTHGWPLRGIYISASGGGGIPHVCIHRTQFPTQTGSQASRIEKLQSALDSAFQFLYEEVTEASRSNWVKAHIWNYRADGLYTPRGGGAGDYAVYVSTNDPPANWWSNI